MMQQSGQCYTSLNYLNRIAEMWEIGICLKYKFVFRSGREWL